MTAPATEVLSFAQGSPQWHELRARATSDLFWFAAHVLGYGERVPMREHMHRAFCRFVERKTGHPALDSARYRKILMPRETGKSTLVTQARVIQQLCENRELSIMIVNEKERTAQDFLNAIKWQFESNELLRALFPELIPKDMNQTTWSASRIVVNRESGRKEPSVFVIGVGGTVTGLHPDRIYVDDMISREAAENARMGSWQIMHQVTRWCHQLDMLLNKNDPNAEITWIGTRWFFDDCYDALDKSFGSGETPRRYSMRVKLPDGTTQITSPYRVGELAVFQRAGIEDGRAAFPEVWPMERMAQSRLRDEVLFAANVMNNPSDELTSTFKPSWLKRYEWISEYQIAYTDAHGKKTIRELRDLDLLFIVDPGGFAQRTVEDRARPAALVIGDDLEGHYFVLDIYNEKDTYTACIDSVCALDTRYHPRKIAVENAGQQIVFIDRLKDALRAQGSNAVVEMVKPRKGSKGTAGTNKPLHILEIEPYFQRGQIYIGTSATFHTFLEQYTQFPRTARVDVLDALAYLPQVVRRTSKVSGARSHHERQDAEIAAYRARRGVA